VRRPARLRLRRPTRLRLKRDPVGLIAALATVALVGLAVLGPLVAGGDPNASHLLNSLQAPSWAGGTGGIFGTDELGRDVWLRMVWGTRTSFTIAGLAVLLGALIGVTVGLLAGYFGGWRDTVLMRFTDLQLSFPALLLLIAITGAIGPSLGLLIIVFGIWTWPIYARLIRGAVLNLRRTEFVAASRSLGASDTRILTKHVLPNVFGVVFAVATLQLADLMLAEAALSFLGYGIQPPGISLGAILADGRVYVERAWWISTFSGLLLAAMVLSSSLLGIRLQRSFDPTRVSA
jgi:peptide/nickel transport system permease protein